MNQNEIVNEVQQKGNSDSINRDHIMGSYFSTSEEVGAYHLH